MEEILESSFKHEGKKRESMRERESIQALNNRSR